MTHQGSKLISPSKLTWAVMLAPTRQGDRKNLAYIVIQACHDDLHLNACSIAALLEETAELGKHLTSFAWIELLV